MKPSVPASGFSTTSFRPSDPPGRREAQSASRTYMSGMEPNQTTSDDDAAAWDERVSRGLERTPRFFQRTVAWLRRPEGKWVRWPVALLFIAGGFLWFLPVLGLWMLPLGLALMSEDIPPLKGWLERAARWSEHRVDRLKARWGRRAG